MKTQRVYYAEGIQDLGYQGNVVVPLPGTNILHFSDTSVHVGVKATIDLKFAFTKGPLRGLLLFTVMFTKQSCKQSTQGLCSFKKVTVFAWGKEPLYIRLCDTRAVACAYFEIRWRILFHKKQQTTEQACTCHLSSSFTCHIFHCITYDCIISDSSAAHYVVSVYTRLLPACTS